MRSPCLEVRWAGLVKPRWHFKHLWPTFWRCQLLKSHMSRLKSGLGKLISIWHFTCIGWHIKNFNDHGMCTFNGSGRQREKARFNDYSSQIEQGWKLTFLPTLWGQRFVSFWCSYRWRSSQVQWLFFTNWTMLKAHYHSYSAGPEICFFLVQLQMKIKHNQVKPLVIVQKPNFTSLPLGCVWVLRKTPPLPSRST